MFAVAHAARIVPSLGALPRLLVAFSLVALGGAVVGASPVEVGAQTKSILVEPPENFGGLTVGGGGAEAVFRVTTDVAVELACRSEPPQKQGVHVTCSLPDGTSLEAAPGVAQDVRVWLEDTGKMGRARVTLTATESGGSGEQLTESASTEFPTEPVVTVTAASDTILALPATRDTALFTVFLDGSGDVNLSAPCNGNLANCVADPATVFLDNSFVEAEASFTTGSVPGLANLTLFADAPGYGSLGEAWDSTLVHVVGTLTVTQLADTVEVRETVGGQVGFQVAYDGPVATSFGLTATCSGVDASSTCAASPDPAIAGGGATDTVWVSVVGGPEGTVGSVTLEATGALQSDQVSVYVKNLTNDLRVSVTPPSDSVYVGVGEQSIARFQVAYEEGPDKEVAFDGVCNPGVTGCSVSPTSRLMSLNDTIDVDVTFTGDAIGATTVDLTVSPNGVGGANEVTTPASVRVVGDLAVAAVSDPVEVIEGQSADVGFDITYTGPLTTFDVSAACAGVAGTCQLSSPTVSAGGGSTGSVQVSIVGGTVSTTGSVTLTAEDTGTGLGAADTVTVNNVGSLAVSPVTTPVEVISAQSADIDFQVAYEGTLKTFNLTAACSGVAGTCALSTTSVQAGDGTTASAHVTVDGGTAGTTGSVTVTATDGTLTDDGTATIHNVVAPQIGVSGPSSTTASEISVANALGFTVDYTDGPSTTLSFSASCGAGVTCGAVSPTSATVAPGSSTPVSVSYTGTALGLSTVSLTATAAADGTQQTDAGDVEIVGTTSVAPLADTVAVDDGTAVQVGFEIAYGGPSESFALSAACSVGLGGTCALSDATVIVGQNVTDTVEVSVTAGTIGSVGTVDLTATPRWNDPTTGRGYVRAEGDAPELTLSLDDQNPGDDYARGACLAVAAGPVGIQCDDVMMAYAMPPVRTLNKARTLNLVYNSQAAHPRPLIGVGVTLPRQPDRLEARLSVDGGSVLQTQEWAGADFQAGTYSRLTLAPDFGGLSTGLHEITIELHWYEFAGAPAELAGSATDTIAVVNWAGSEVGPGWNHSAGERIYPAQPGGEILLVTADGSTLVYEETVAGTTWTARRNVLPDEIHLVTDHYERELVGGGTVLYDLDGRMTEVRDRFGNASRFVYDTSGKLTDVYFPTKSSEMLAYRLFYDTSERLDAVDVVGGISGSWRRTNLTPSAAGPTVLTAPDGVDMNLTYGAHDLLETVTDAFGALTTLTYDTASTGEWLRVAEVKSTATGEGDIVHAYEAFASRGVDIPVPVADAYARIDGPRTDVTDVATFWLTGWRAPREVKNFDGTATLYRTNPAFPRLVTEVRQPNGRLDKATYDATGRLKITTVGTLKPTSYTWNDTWNEVSSVEQPEGETRNYLYDPDGTLGSEHWSGHTASEVSYDYKPNRALVASVTQGGLTTSFDYDGHGNLQTVTAPDGKTTRYDNDHAGRVETVTSPRGSGGTRTKTTTYDAVDRVKTETVDGVTVTNDYDPVTGALETLTRSGSGVPSLATRYGYDGFGRRDRETAPDGEIERYTHDAAGNVKTRTTRRGLTIRMEYDPMGRLLHETRPASNGPTSTDPHFWHQWIGVPVRDVTIGGETLDYTYDSMGNLETADNDAAEVTRLYDDAGRMTQETLTILGYEGSPSRTFTTAYFYDDNGRRAVMRRPSEVAASGNRDVTYTYDSTRGHLRSMKVADDSVVWTRDNRGRVSRIDHGPHVEDLDHGTNDLVKSRTVSNALNTYIDDFYTYEDDGRKRRISGAFVDSDMAYNAAGRLTQFDEEDAVSDTAQWTRSESRTWDAYGNPTLVEKTDTATRGYAKFMQDRQPTYGGPAYRLTGYGLGSTVSETMSYDDAGNRIRYRTTIDAKYFVDEEMFYDAAGQLRFMDRRICETANPVFGNRRCIENVLAVEPTDTVFRDHSVFQEYRYDALGRRVLTYSRANDTQCEASNCPNFIERTVWDGEQILAEIRYPSVDLEAADGSTITADLGRINGTVDVADGLKPFGVVSYIQGPEIDKPLILERQHHNPSVPTEVLYEYVIEDALGYPVPPEDDHACEDKNGKRVPCECVDDDTGEPVPCAGWKQDLNQGGRWPSGEARHTGARLKRGPSFWMGTLMEDGEDATGLLYRRNRYYDPEAGQFTQEDPIGLAGGLNLYGYAGGDPINFSDPFGLCPWCWVAFEVASSVYDIYQTVQAYRRSPAEGAAALEATVFGAISPGPGTLYMRAANHLDELASAARVLDRRGFSAAGRALTKHARGQRAGSRLFPALSGNVDDINRAAQGIVDDILTTPGSTFEPITRGRFKGGFEVWDPSGRGLRYNADGEFVTFLERGGS